MVLEWANGLRNVGFQIFFLVDDATYEPWLHFDKSVVYDAGHPPRKHFEVGISTFYTTGSHLDRCRFGIKVKLVLDNYYRYGRRTTERKEKIDNYLAEEDSIIIFPSDYLKSLYGRYEIMGSVVAPGLDRKLFFDPQVERKRNRILIEGYKRPYKGLGATYSAIPSNCEIWGLGITRHDVGRKPQAMWVRPSQSKLNEIYGACGALVKLERHAGFPQAIIEAMACGTPVIVSGIGGQMDYCRDNWNSLIAAHNNDVGGLIDVLLRDDELFKELQRNGLKTAEQYCWERSSDNLNQLIGYEFDI